MKIILAAVVAIWMGLGALAVRPAQADDVKVFSAGAVRAIGRASCRERVSIRV